jgi:membrane-bound lytic murein transglycosylase F
LYNGSVIRPISRGAASAAVTALLALLVWGQPQRTFGSDLAHIQTRGTLRVIVWADTQPELFSGKPGALPGFEREILQSFADLQGLKLEIVPVATLAGRIPALLEGRGDVVAGGLAATSSRREQVEFTAEIFPIMHAVVNLKPNKAVATLEELRRERVGTVKGSSWAELVASADVPKSNVDDNFSSLAEMLAGLRASRISAIVLSVRIAILEQRRHPNIQIGLRLGEPISGAYAVRKDEPRLLAALNEYIQNLRRTPTWNRLVVKYFGENALEALQLSRPH